MGETGPQTIAVDGETYEYDAEKPWRDADLLETLYWEKGMNQQEIADAVGCSDVTISSWMEKLGVDVQTAAKRPATHYIRNDGYEMCQSRLGGETDNVQVHRLLAVAEYGFDAVVDKHVHHKNHIRYDNRPQNIEVKSPKEHAFHHNDERHENDKTPWRDAEKLRRMYVEESMLAQEIADEWGCSDATIHRWIDEHGINRRSKSEAQKLRYSD
jgi:DNA invertase Pin-like site-specific DNA recombinase